MSLPIGLFDLALANASAPLGTVSVHELQRFDNLLEFDQLLGLNETYRCGLWEIRREDGAKMVRRGFSAG